MRKSNLYKETADYLRTSWRTYRTYFDKSEKSGENFSIVFFILL